MSVIGAGCHIFWSFRRTVCHGLLDLALWGSFVVLALPGIARAQGEGEEGKTDNAEQSIAQSVNHREAQIADHEAVVGMWGVAVADVTGIFQQPGLSVRRWGSPGRGWEAGLSLLIVNESDATDFGVGAMFGYLVALSTFDHMVVFMEPEGGLSVFKPDSQDSLFTFRARMSLGAEIQLGMMGLPQLAVTTRVSAGVDVTNDSDSGDTRLRLGTFGSENNSVRGVLEGTLGFVFYFGGADPLPSASQDI